MIRKLKDSTYHESDKENHYPCPKKLKREATPVQQQHSQLFNTPLTYSVSTLPQTCLPLAYSLNKNSEPMSDDSDTVYPESSYSASISSRSSLDTTFSQVEDTITFEIACGEKKTFKKHFTFLGESHVNLDTCWSQVEILSSHTRMFVCNMDKDQCKLVAFLHYAGPSIAHFYVEVGEHKHVANAYSNSILSESAVSEKFQISDTPIIDYTDQLYDLTQIEMLNYCISHSNCEITQDEECPNHVWDQSSMIDPIFTNGDIQKRSLLKFMHILTDERNKTRSFVRENVSVAIETAKVFKDLRLVTEFLRKVTECNNEVLSQRFIDLIRVYGWEAFKEMLLNLISSEKKRSSVIVRK